LKVAPKIEDPRSSAMSKIWLAAVVAGGVFYVVLKERVLRKLEDDGGRIVPNWVAKILREALGCYSKLVGVREVSTGGEGLACDQSRKYMLVWHPHGFITWVPFFIAGRYALDAQPTGAHWFPMVAPVLFRIPIFSEMLIILGARRVDKKVVEKMLARGDSIALQPGGVKEQALSDDQQEQAFFPARLGFIRMAIKYGVDLLPIYFFGENQLYKRVRGLEWISNLVNKTTGMTLPMVTSRLAGCFHCRRMYILVLAALFLLDLLTQNPVRKGWRKSSASIWQNSVDSFENMRRTACRQMLRNVDFALSDWMASRCQWRSSRKYKTEAPKSQPRPPATALAVCFACTDTK